MAKISTYPVISTPTLNDLLIGTDVENFNETKNFTIADILAIGTESYVPYIGATGNVNLGLYSIFSSSYVVSGGTSSQFLKADGSLDSTIYTPQSRTLSINGVSYDLSANRSWVLGTIDTLTTTGTSGAATYVGNVLNIPVYQGQGNYITDIIGEATASGPGVSSMTLSNSAVIGKVLTGLNITGGSVIATDSIIDAFGKVQNQINSLIGGSIYKGTWNASTNTPTLTSSVGTTGWYYIVSVAGTTNLNGITDWQLGDWVIFDGTVWQKVDNTDAVISVNGYTGIVNLTYSDVGAVPTSRTLTINGTDYDLSSNRSWNVGTVTSIGTSGPITGGTITNSGTIGITQAGAASDGYLSSTDWNTFNNKLDTSVNIYNTDGTLTGNRIVTLNDKQLVYRTNASNLQNYTFTIGTPTGAPINTWPSSVIYEGEYLMNSGYAEPFNTRVWGRNQSSSLRQFWVNQVYADLTNESTGNGGIFNQSFYTRRGSQLDTGTGIVAFMRGVSSNIGHDYTSPSSTSTNIVTNQQVAFYSLSQNLVGTINNAYSFYARHQVGYNGTPNTTLVTNLYGIYLESFVLDSKSTVTNFYGLYLNTPSVSSGTITNRWGIYATDSAMKHYINGTVLIGSATDSTLAKLQVTGAIQQTSVTSSMLKVNSSGVLVAAIAGTDYQPAGSYVTGSGTTYYIPMWSSSTSITDSIISYASNVVNFNYNSSSGATVNYINTSGTTYTYSIQMNNTGSPRQTYHIYTDGNIIQRIGSNDVSKNLSTGQLVLPYYTTTSSFTGTPIGTLAFDSSGNIITTAPSVSTNIYNSDGTLTGNRTVTMSSYWLSFNGGNVLFGSTSDNGARVQVNGGITTSDKIRSNFNNANGTATIGTFFSNTSIAQFVNNDNVNSGSSYGYMQHSDGTNYIGGSKSVFEYGNVGIGSAPSAINSFEVNRANQWSGAFIGNMTGARTPSVAYGIHLGWNYTGGSGEANILWGTGSGGSNPYLVFSSWDGSTKTDRVEFQDNGRIVFKQYTSSSSFTGTPVGYLAFDSTGNILTASISSGTVTSIATSGPITGGTITTSGTIGITQSTTSTDGYLSSTDWNTFNGKVPSTRTLTINGVSQDLSSDRTWTVSDTNIYNSDGTLTGNRTVATTSGYTLTFNPQTIVSTTSSASISASSDAFYTTNAISYTAGFSSSSLGNTYSSSDNYLNQSFEGSATFANSNLNASVIGINSIDFINAGNTITMTQASGIRSMASAIFQNQYKGTQSGTISHLSGLQILGNYRSAGAGTLTITNAYGLLINDLNDYGTGFTLSNRWGLYQSGSLDKNYFGGEVLIRTLTSSGAALTIGPSTATSASVNMITTGSVLETAPDTGDLEVDADGQLYYTHNNLNRGVVTSEQFLVQNATFTLGNNTNLQRVFNASANGALTVKGATTYFFECYLIITSMSATSGNMGFSVLGGGTATVTSTTWFSHGLDNSNQATGATITGMSSTTATQTGNILSAGTGTAAHTFIKGVIRVNAGGTIIPSVQQTNAAAAVVGVNSWFRIWAIGTNTVTTVGNWS